MPGDTGTNKTFVAVGWACSIATGAPWLGRGVCIEPSTVVLVVGEGEHGLDARITAWELEHAVKVPQERIRVLVRPSIDENNASEETFWQQLAAFAKAVDSRFVVFDTLSSLMPAVDETKEAATVLALLHGLIAEINGTAVLLHHVGWNNPGRVRGGTQFEQNADAVIVLKKTNTDDPDGAVELIRKKVKDGPSGAKIYIQRVPSGTSCVLKEVGRGGAPAQRLSQSEVADVLFGCSTASRWSTPLAPQRSWFWIRLAPAPGATSCATSGPAWSRKGLSGSRSAPGAEGKNRLRWERVPPAEVPSSTGGGEVDGEVDSEPGRQVGRRS